jgi:hypothetical protein
MQSGISPHPPQSTRLECTSQEAARQTLCLREQKSGPAHAESLSGPAQQPGWLPGCRLDVAQRKRGVKVTGCPTLLCWATSDDKQQPALFSVFCHLSDPVVSHKQHGIQNQHRNCYRHIRLVKTRAFAPERENDNRGESGHHIARL